MQEATYIMESKKETQRLESKINLDDIKNQLLKVGLQCGMESIDIGCGAGKITKLISEIASPAKAVGVDINQERIDYARNNYKNINLEFIVGDIYKLPFKDNRFNFVFCRFLFEYLKDPKKAFKEMVRITKDGGMIVVIDIDGHFLNHYPISKRLYSDLKKIIYILEKKYGFDSQVGKKLYYYMKSFNLRNIEVEIDSYQKIIGKPDLISLNNWKQKIDTIVKLLENDENLDKKWLYDLAKKFMDHIMREDTISYSNLIIAKGIV